MRARNAFFSMPSRYSLVELVKVIRQCWHMNVCARELRQAIEVVIDAAAERDGIDEVSAQLRNITSAGCDAHFHVLRGCARRIQSRNLRTVFPRPSSVRVSCYILPALPRRADLVAEVKIV